MTAPELWLAPNAGSEDLRGLWRGPARWARVRKHVSTLQLYRQNLRQPHGDVHAALVGPNTIDSLRESGLDGLALDGLRVRVALEAPAYKGPGTMIGNAQATRQAVRTCQRLGIQVSAVSMDEPMVAARRADEDMLLVAGLIEEHFDLGVAMGDIEAWPYLSVQEHLEWIEVLACQLKRAGRPLAHYHLDVDVRALRQEHPSSSDLTLALRRALEAIGGACRDRGITFGVIVPGYVPGADQDVDVWGEGARWILGKVWGVAPWVPRVIVQSWQGPEGGARTVPRNLPEQDPSTLTGLAARAVELWSS